MHIYVTVGTWFFQPRQLGFSVFKYDPDNADLEKVFFGFDGLATGMQLIDPERGIVYVTDEVQDQKDRQGGGGSVYALKINPENGSLTELNHVKTLGSKPSYIASDRKKQYLLVSNHGGRSYVTRIRKDSDGNFHTEINFEDASLVLMRLAPDGTIGEVCDCEIFRGTGKTAADNPHLHCVVPDPEGEFFVVCNKGSDQIYSYMIDRENYKLRRTHTFYSEKKYAPRYCAFHPTLPVFYTNNENEPYLFSFHYNKATGSFDRFATTCLHPSHMPGQTSQPSDLIVSGNGKNLYATDRKSGSISVFDIDPEGGLSFRQIVDCGGQDPRGICLSPDGRFLLSANVHTENIAVFRVAEDGLLSLQNASTKCVRPANIRFFC